MAWIVPAAGAAAGGRVDAVLLQLVQRAADFAPKLAGRAGFHLDEHRGGAGVRDLAKRARDCAVRDAGLALELADLRERGGGREGGAEACFDQFRIVRIGFP